MGGKKKKKGGGGKKKKKEKTDGDDEPKEMNPDFIVNLPPHGWIRTELRLCDPPFGAHNSFKVVMRSDERILELRQRIIDYHGRIEGVNVYNMDPYPPRNKKNDFRMEKKHRVPPFTKLQYLLDLQKEKEQLDEAAEKKAKKLAELKELGRAPDSDKENDDDIYQEKEDPKKYDCLQHFDFKSKEMQVNGQQVVEYYKHYNDTDTTLYEIFGVYGSSWRPKENPKFDPEPPAPKEEKKAPTPVIKPKKEEDEEGEGNEDGEGEPVVPEEEEPPYEPPCDQVLFYEFVPHDTLDPILLALMIKGLKDECTL